MPRFTTAAIASRFINTLSATLAGTGIQGVLSRSPTLSALSESVGNITPFIGPAVPLWAFSLMLGALLQVLLVNAWLSGFRDRSVLPLAMGLAFSLISALASATTFVFVTQEAALTRALRARVLSPVVESLRSTADALNAAADQTRAVAREADRLREVEKASGGTCEGDTPHPGEGPRMRLRERHAADLAQASAQMDRLAERMFALSLDIADISPQQAQKRYAEALTLSRAPATRDLLQLLAAKRRELEEGFVDPQTNRGLTCRTPAMADMLAEAEATLAAALRMEVHDLAAPEAGLSDSLDAILADLQAWMSGADLSATSRATGLRALQYAVVVELFQWLLLLWNFRQRARLGQIPSVDDDFIAVNTFGTARQQEIWDRVQRVLHEQTLRSGGKLWLVVDAGRPSPAEISTLHYFDLLNRRHLRHPEWQGVPLEELYPDWVAARRHLFPSGAFDLYPLPHHVLAWMRKAWRSAIADHREDRQASTGAT